MRAFSLGAGAPAMTILSLFCLLSGAVLAGLAPRRSVRQAALESAGGGLIVLGVWLAQRGTAPTPAEELDHVPVDPLATTPEGARPPTDDEPDGTSPPGE